MNGHTKLVFKLRFFALLTMVAFAFTSVIATKAIYSSPIKDPDFLAKKTEARIKGKKEKKQKPKPGLKLKPKPDWEVLNIGLGKIITIRIQGYEVNPTFENIWHGKNFDKNEIMPSGEEDLKEYRVFHTGKTQGCFGRQNCSPKNGAPGPGENYPRF